MLNTSYQLTWIYGGIALQKSKQQPLKLIILAILVFTFLGIVVDNFHSKDNRLLGLYTSQKQIRHDANQLINEKRRLENPMVSYHQAYQSFTHRQFQQAYTEILPYALSADVNATLVIGFLREFGLGITKDMKKAALWYYIGVKQNTYNKQSILRGLHAYNQGNYNMATEWFRLASELNYAI